MPTEIIDDHDPRPEAYVRRATSKPITRILRRVEIYEADRTTLYKTFADLDLIGGQVTADYSRAERRNIQLSLANFDDQLQITPGQIWYDKIIKVYRGYVAFHPETNDEEHWYFTLGEFMIDELDYGTHPKTIEITGRDFAKKLMLSKFKETTIFSEGSTLEDVVQAIALAGGIPISKMSIPIPTGVVLDQSFIFEIDTSRWDALEQICTTYNWEVFLDRSGLFTLQIWKDPNDFEPTHTFTTGFTGNLGYNLEPHNIIEIQKKRRDTRIFNVVIVIGEAANMPLPAYGIAENTNVNSPTSVAKIGERVKVIKMATVNTDTKAQTLAERFLTVMALEEFEAQVTSVVFPWLREADNVELHHEDYFEGEPVRFHVANTTIPLGLEPMETSIKRVIDWATVVV